MPNYHKLPSQTHCFLAYISILSSFRLISFFFVSLYPSLCWINPRLKSLEFSLAEHVVALELLHFSEAQLAVVTL